MFVVVVVYCCLLLFVGCCWSLLVGGCLLFVVSRSSMCVVCFCCYSGVVRDVSLVVRWFEVRCFVGLLSVVLADYYV